MNTVVNQLLQVDREAQFMIEEARRYHDQTLEEIEEEKGRLREEFRQKGESHIQQLEAELADEVAEDERALHSRANQALQKLEARYEALHTQWEDTLYRRCVDGFRGLPAEEERD